MSPCGERADTNVSGMMCMRKSTVDLAVRLGGVVERPRLPSSVAGSTLKPAPGLSTCGDDQADDERERRDDLEVEQRLAADAADLLHVLHAGDAGDDGTEDDRRR